MYGGERGIRTLDTLSRIHAFQACAFNHSATSPCPSGKRGLHRRCGRATQVVSPAHFPRASDEMAGGAKAARPAFALLPGLRPDLPHPSQTRSMKFGLVRISSASRPDRPTPVRARLHRRSFEKVETSSVRSQKATGFSGASAVFSGDLHRSAIRQRPHSGFLALQT